MDQIFPKNRRTARNIAIGLSVAVVALNLGLDGGIGATQVFSGFTVTKLATVATSLWVAIGLFKFRFG